MIYKQNKEYYWALSKIMCLAHDFISPTLSNFPHYINLMALFLNFNHFT